MNSFAAAGYMISGNLNEGIGDASPGSPKAGTFAQSSGYPAQLGNIVYLDNEGANQRTNPSGTITQLYGGFYQYVQLVSTASAAVAAGQLVFFDTVANAANFVVTTDVTAATIGRVAGVILSPSWTKGNYWWIQISGLVYVKCAATVTDTTDGNLAIVTQTPAPTVNGVADGTAVTDAVLKSAIGVWAEAPANGALKRVFFNPRAMFM